MKSDSLYDFLEIIVGDCSDSQLLTIFSLVSLELQLRGLFKSHLEEIKND